MAVIGLDYPAVKLIADTRGLKWTEELFCKIKLLESWYLNHIDEVTPSGSANKNNNKRKRTG